MFSAQAARAAVGHSHAAGPPCALAGRTKELAPCKPAQTLGLGERIDLNDAQAMDVLMLEDVIPVRVRSY